jgi:Ran GTPase-activating protein (RanGAP) involved in mRNA processing and transport
VLADGDEVLSCCLQALAASLPADTHSLDLRGCAINHLAADGFPFLRAMSASCAYVQVLDLSNNALRQQSMVLVGEFLALEDSTLTDLNLSDNCLCADSIGPLVEAIHGNTCLSRLDLSRNALGKGLFGAMGAGARGRTQSLECALRMNRHNGGSLKTVDILQVRHWAWNVGTRDSTVTVKFAFSN